MRTRFLRMGVEPCNFSHCRNCIAITRHMDAVQGRFTPSWPPLLLLTPSPSLQISLATRRQQPAGQAPACTAGTCTCVHVAGSCTTGSCGSRVPPSWGRHTLPHSVIDVVWRATYLPLPPCRCLYCTPLSLSQTLDAGVSPARPAGTCGAGTCLHCRYLRARQVASCPRRFLRVPRGIHLEFAGK